jgi:hypothetical protein
MERVERLVARPHRWKPEEVTRDQVAKAIASETRFGYKRALRFVDSMRENIQSRLADGETYWLPSTQWLDDNHEMLMAIAPDDQRSAPGSAHSLLERHILDPKKGQLGLVHDMRHEAGRRHCAVSVITESVQL